MVTVLLLSHWRLYMLPLSFFVVFNAQVGSIRLLSSAQLFDTAEALWSLVKVAVLTMRLGLDVL